MVIYSQFSAKYEYINLTEEITNSPQVTHTDQHSRSERNNGTMSPDITDEPTFERESPRQQNKNLEKRASVSNGRHGTTQVPRSRASVQCACRTLASDYHPKSQRSVICVFDTHEEKKKENKERKEGKQSNTLPSRDELASHLEGNRASINIFITGIHE